jgi:ketosteroid isomerase-like protein
MLTPSEKLAGARRSYAAFSAGPDIDALLPLYDRECEWHLGPMGAAFGTEAFRGHEGLRAWASALAEGFDDFHVNIDEARVTGDGVLLLRGHARGRARDADMDVSLPVFWQQMAFRKSRVERIVQFEEPPPGWDTATPVT